LALPNDTTFGMPLFYNATTLKQGGVAPPTTNWDQPWSWEQWTEAGKKLTQNDGSASARYGTQP
jgi:ABC-type glycerol-3-phosphate transport system substrate-binding protein